MTEFWACELVAMTKNKQAIKKGLISSIAILPDFLFVMRNTTEDSEIVTLSSLYLYI